nr:D-alanine--poly(phosphoribitol) ligase [Lachnospira sp.]
YDNNKKKILLFVMGDADKKELLEELREDLPSYMIPNKVIMIDEMPMTKNGKIDRNALKQVAGL